MYYPISQKPAGLVAIAIAGTMAMVLLLGFATPAGAETGGGLQGAVDAVAEDATTGVQAPTPTAEVEPEATNVPEVAPPATDVVEKVSEPIATAATEPVATVTSQASKLADDVGQRVADVQQRTAETGEQVVESAGSVASAADDGAALVSDGEALVSHAVSSSQDSLKRAGENLAETGKGLSSTSSALLSKAVLSASQAISSARSATGFVFSPASQELPPPSAADAQTFTSPPANGSPSSEPGRTIPVELGVDFLDSLFLRPLAGFGGVAPLQLWASPPSGDFFASDQAALENSAIGGSPSAASGVPVNPNPPNGDDPLPQPLESSPAAASGLGGSPSFVPIVGLLALLALVSPTDFRRLREMPAFAAPTPFVCALERPG